MENTNQNYLESLIEWGERIKDILKEKNIPEEELQDWTIQIEDWQKTVQLQMHEERANSQDIANIKEEGKRILDSIKGQKGTPINDSHISYGKHKLPELPYAYDALEPFISEDIMRLHHDEHHKSYVDGLNKAEDALYSTKKDREPIKHWLREQAFHGSGHYLHTIFWNNVSPNSSKNPTGEFLMQLDQDFGSFKNFKTLFTETAASVEGVGWAVLVWEPRSGRLAIQSFEKHQMFHIADTIPLLVLDMWEHAYYLQYQTDKRSYIQNWWNVVNWDDVSKRYTEARKLKWKLS
ncbi:superoxide dismutase [Ornithinibacillus halophilus]|nr:superoxide dismutase [Ornithinibacillus halophilus]